MNLPTARVKVACINWLHADAPHALVYLWDGEEMGATTYCDTWAEAMTVADRWAGLLRHKVVVMQGVPS